jgi:5-methylcytosine-specific restriction endonuclease McrA
VLAEHEEVIRTVSREYSLPSVIRLKRYVKIIKRIGLATCTRKNVLMRDKFQCQYCGIQCRPSVVTIDHVIPRSKGGDSTWINLVAACQPCNRRKGNKLLAEAGMKLRKIPRSPAWRELIAEPKFGVQEDWLLYLGKVC